MLPRFKQMLTLNFGKNVVKEKVNFLKNNDLDLIYRSHGLRGQPAEQLILNGLPSKGERKRESDFR